MNTSRLPDGQRVWLLQSASVAIGVSAPLLAFAHTGYSSVAGFSAGALHPWSGLDHLLAMALVGCWAMQCGGRRRWACPLLFVTAMILGSIGAAPVFLPAHVDRLAAVSVLALGLAVTLQARLPAWITGLFIAAFAVIHGHAHGMEAAAHASRFAFTAGFSVATLALHMGGMLVAAAALRCKQPLLLQGAGAAAALAAAVLIVHPAAF